MVPTSTIPAFRAALIAMLAARTGLAGVAVCDGPPPPNVLQGKEFICLLETKGRQSVRALAPRQPRDERYSQTVEISVVGATRSDQVTLGNRAFALLAELEDGIRTNVNLTGFYSGAGQLLSLVLVGEDYRTFADDGARESRLELSIDVHAHL